MIAAVLVGVVLWIPMVLIVAIVGGPWFSGLQVYAALAPVLALLLPGLANASRRRSGRLLAAWSVALAPLLAAIGSIAQLLVKRRLNGNVYSEFYENRSVLLVCACCIVIGIVLHLCLRLSANRAPHGQHAKNSSSGRAFVGSTGLDSGH